jgi:low temperature requirement protein LtrA
VEVDRWRRVTLLELFPDLVFVFAITQVTVGDEASNRQP